VDRKVRTEAPLLVALATALAVLSPAPTWAATPAGQPSAVVIDATGEAAPAAPGRPYAATGRPDRIVLSPGADASRGMGVAWRSDIGQTVAGAEIVKAVAAPNFSLSARPLTGTSVRMKSENGEAIYHSVRFENLEPDTRYYYRVKGAQAWSEWLQFRTAAETFKPFRFIYLGDTQNRILEIGSLAFRQAILKAGDAALMLHAGDLVASRDDMIHDDEWGQWTESGGFALAMIPQAPAAGNHEYVDDILPNGSERRRLGAHWPLSFTLPGNGAAGVKGTSYVTDYQGLRVIVLDGTAALDLGQLDSQTKWLDARLAESKARWNVVLFHQPIFTCARPNDTTVLKAAWKPVFEARNVDLVLQGHDHCYGRLTSELGKAAGAEARAKGGLQGPVYMVSVTGAKMYGLNDRSATQPDRVAEDTSLFQIIDLEENRLKMRSYTATGDLYDGFDLVRRPDGAKLLEELPDDLPRIRRCNAGLGPDGLPCTADPKD